MSVNALVVFRDGNTRVVEVPSPAPRDLRVNTSESIIPTWVSVFRPQDADNAPIYEQP